MSASFNELIFELTEGRPPRVWSFLVTIFGDLAQSKDARISGAVLGRMTEMLGIKPEANRVALHRLRKEGWIASERSGRNSLYSLTDWGLAQSRAASPRIYARSLPSEDVWLLVSDASARDTEMPGHPVAPGLRLTSVPIQEEGVLCTRLSDAATPPNWLRSRICDEDALQHAQTALAQFRYVHRAYTEIGPLSPLEVALLRALIVHTWRRIALRVPELSDRVFPEDWCGSDCRALAAELLDSLPKPDLVTLENCVAGRSAA